MAATYEVKDKIAHDYTYHKKGVTDRFCSL